MKLKFLHLNIQMGRFMPGIIKYVRKHDFDIINFQEVMSGEWWYGFKASRQFEVLKQKLGYEGEIAAHFNNPSSYFGNVTLFKKSITLRDKKLVPLKKIKGPWNFRTRKLKDFPRSALSLLLEKNDKQIRVINCHLAWGKGPFERTYHRAQNQRLIDYVKTVKDPFILSGDFNLTADTRTVKELNKLARNLTVQNHITNTLNPRTHYAKHLFPTGYAVDFVYASRGITSKKFHVIQDDLSDHLGLSAEFEI
jgi:endonuclease/exonuclease/phosphatase family metal-dependent hydrolase